MVGSLDVVWLSVYLVFCTFKLFSSLYIMLIGEKCQMVLRKHSSWAPAMKLTEYSNFDDNFARLFLIIKNRIGASSMLVFSTSAFGVLELGRMLSSMIFCQRATEN